MIEGVLFMCAFMTLTVVCCAAYVTAVAVTIFYKQQSNLTRYADALPLRVDHAINAAVAKYVEPFKKAQDGYNSPITPELMMPSEANRNFADWLIGEE